MKKVGGLYFWSLGCIGGSIYFKRPVGRKPIWIAYPAAIVVGGAIGAALAETALYLGL